MILANTTAQSIKLTSFKKILEKLNIRNNLKVKKFKGIIRKEDLETRKHGYLKLSSTII